MQAHWGVTTAGFSTESPAHRGDQYLTARARRRRRRNKVAPVAIRPHRSYDPAAARSCAREYGSSARRTARRLRRGKRRKLRDVATFRFSSPPFRYGRRCFNITSTGVERSSPLVVCSTFPHRSHLSRPQEHALLRAACSLSSWSHPLQPLYIRLVFADEEESESKYWLSAARSLQAHRRSQLSEVSTDCALDCARRMRPV
ncbi:hypothetical protein C8Q77DRAFT_23786 [Trametes polyzona]|nr:hypothetical protein C8Q77DRAFT_23786 [Trametes polyzona]